MKENLKHLSLFILTFITTTFAGLEWTSGKTVLFSDDGFGFGVGITSADWQHALMFSSAFLLILTVHEFGHYFTGIYYKVKVTLPYYIPMWFFGWGLSIGTMGAFIKIKSPLRTTKEFFDVGVAGPLAGFVAAIFVIWYGFETLPPAEYIYNIHPEYKEFGLDYANHFYDQEGIFSIGENLLFMFFKSMYVGKAHLIPNNFELMHYPFLFAGYLACFFTALNLIPIGQLDGGHVLYGLIGHKRSNKAFPYIYKVFLFYAGLGLFSVKMPQEEMFYIPLYIFFLSLCFQRLYPDIKERFKWVLIIFLLQLVSNFFFPAIEGYQGWLLFGLIIGRFLGIKHPPSMIEQDIGLKRKILGYAALVVFILCFSPHPFVF